MRKAGLRDAPSAPRLLAVSEASVTPLAVSKSAERLVKLSLCSGTSIPWCFDFFPWSFLSKNTKEIPWCFECFQLFFFVFLGFLGVSNLFAKSAHGPSHTRPHCVSALSRPPPKTPKPLTTLDFGARGVSSPKPMHGQNGISGLLLRPHMIRADFREGDEDSNFSVLKSPAVH